MPERWWWGWSYLIDREFGWPQTVVIVISMPVVTGLVIAGFKLWSCVTVSLVVMKVGALMLFCALAVARSPGEFHHVAGLAVFSFLGFDGVSTPAQETGNPKRDMPVGVSGTPLVATALYVAVAASTPG